MRIPSLGKSILYIFLLAVAIVQLFPLIWMFFFSLKSNLDIYGGNILGPPQHWIWNNYIIVFKNGNIGRYLFNSVLITLVTIVMTCLLSVMASYAIVRMKWRLNKLVLILFLLGMMVPIHAALLPLFIIFKNIGLLNTYAALIIPYTAYALPIGISVASSFLESIPREIEESACLDGCSIYGMFFRIVMPLLRPVMATIAIFTYLSTWNELLFSITFVGKTSMKTITAGVMSMVGQFSTNWGSVGAGLTVVTIPTLIVYILLSNQVQQSLTAGALKG